MITTQDRTSTTGKILQSVSLCAIIALASCGGGGGKSPSSTQTSPAPFTGTEKANTVVLVVLENMDYAEVVGSADAPYFNSLVSKGTLAIDYFANVHPSMGDYLMLTTGAMVSKVDTFPGPVAPPEIVSALTGAGKSWKVYAEGIPSVGYTGPDTGTLYLQRHNPISYFSDVINTPAKNNIVPISQLATDAAGTLPNFSMIVGGIYNIGHNCLPTVVPCTTSARVQQADKFLQATLPQILANAGFQSSGMVAITFDESDTDHRNGSGLQTGGGQVATLLVGNNVKVGAKANGIYLHESLLRLMLDGEEVSALPNGAATAPSMATEVWK